MMKITSPAGELQLSLNNLEVREGILVLKGSMGLWDAEGALDREDLIVMIKLLMRPSVLFQLFKILFKCRRESGRC